MTYNSSKYDLIDSDMVRELFEYDSNTGILLRDGKEAGYVDNRGYRRVKIYGKPYRSHVIAWLYFYGSLPNNQIDHINGDKINNSISNLRDVSQSENNRNAKLRCDNKTGQVGVYLRDNGKYGAVINYKKEREYLGSFELIEDAVAARVDAQRRLEFHENHGRNMNEVKS